MKEFFINLLGLLLIATATGSAFALGTWLFGDFGGLLGVVAGTAWGFCLATECAALLREQVDRTRTLREGFLSLVSDSGRFYPPEITPSWPERLMSVPFANAIKPGCAETLGLEEIYGALKKFNAHLWKQLRVGTLSGCHPLLYTVQLEEGGIFLDWRAVNRKLLSCFGRFDRAKTEEERLASLMEALDRVGQKLQIVKQVLALRGSSAAREEQEEVKQKEAELWCLSRPLRSRSLELAER